MRWWGVYQGASPCWGLELEFFLALKTAESICLATGNFLSSFLYSAMCSSRIWQFFKLKTRLTFLCHSFIGIYLLDQLPSLPSSVFVLLIFTLFPLAPWNQQHICWILCLFIVVPYMDYLLRYMPRIINWPDR